MERTENIVDACRKFLGLLDSYVTRMPRDRKFTIGDRLITRGMDLLETATDAYYSPREEKKAKIRKANLNLEILRQLLRHLFETQAHHQDKHEHFSREILKIGTSLGAWAKSL